MSRKIRWAAALLLLSVATYAQTNCLYTFQDPSPFYYARTRDSLRKAWTCPPLFKERTIQKKYKEIWDERTDRLSAAINEDDYVHDKEVYDCLDAIVRQIMEGDRALFPEKPLVLIDRSEAVNAYAMGGNVLAVNLGLITFAQTREELALAIAHELSHNILHHYENAMRQKAEWLTSGEYRQSLNECWTRAMSGCPNLKKLSRPIPSAAIATNATTKARRFPGGHPITLMIPRLYFNVSNPDSRSSYLIVENSKNINIYNVSRKKIQRTVPHMEGKTEVSVFPAKEGYVMVHEVNLKEKTTRLSIEAL